ncbi:MAG TPA: hypothetical protein VFY30_06800, partial [Solirubrobacterales bacterium]|nr:hypothetical protein [Solirubrobacterales bacterium]
DSPARRAARQRPQVGLLALMSDAYTDTAPYPLDVLGSEAEGQIGPELDYGARSKSHESAA